MFLVKSAVKAYFKRKGKRVAQSVLLVLDGHVQNLMDQACRNTPKVTVREDDVFPGRK